jgi:translation initiation factor IF-2
VGLRPPNGGAHGTGRRRPRRRDGWRRGAGGDRADRPGAGAAGGHRIVAAQRGRRPRPVATARRPRGGGGRFARASVRGRRVRSRREPAPRRRPVGRDRTGAPPGRDLLLAADRARDQPGADRLLHGAAAGQPAPQRGERPSGGGGGRPRGGGAARLRPARRVLRRGSRRLLPAQGALDGARLHSRGLRRPPPGHARAHTERRDVHRHGPAPVSPSAPSELLSSPGSPCSCCSRGCAGAA